MMSAAQRVKVLNILNKCLKSEEQANTLVAGIEGIVQDKIDDEKRWFASKDDIRRLEVDIKNLEIRMEQGFKDMLKWMIVLMISFSSLIIAVVKFL